MLLLVVAGKGRVFKCLQESLAQPDFGQACRGQVEERSLRMQEDYRLDYGVAEACEPDVATFCSAEKVRRLNEGTVLLISMQMRNEGRAPFPGWLLF